MEALRQKRKALRGSCTKVFNALDEQLKLDNPDAEGLAGLIAQVEEKGNKLDELDDTILTSMQGAKCSQEEYDHEFEAAEVYRDRGALLKTKAQRVLARLDNSKKVVVPTEKEGASLRKYRLPEIELKKFDGNAREWLGFWGQFKKIHDDKEIDLEDKYQYLIQATVVNSKARELVQSFPPTAGNYSKAIEHLKTRFGRDETLVEVYVRELLRLVLNNVLNPKSRESLSELYDKLETQLRALETLGVTTDKYAAMLYPLVEACIPEESLRAWERSRVAVVASGEANRDEGAVTQHRLTMLMTFLRTEVEGEERIRMARTGFGFGKEVQKKSKKPFMEETLECPTAVGLFSGQSNSNSSKEIPCVFCDKGHPGRDCYRAIRMSLDEKRKIVRQKGCCFACLKSGHLAKACRISLRCSGCGKRHYEVMCPESAANQKGKQSEKAESQDKALANMSISKEILLQTLNVVLKGAAQERTVRALIDTGSQKSYITNRAAAIMEYPSLGQERISHILFGGGQTELVEHQKYRVFLKSESGHYHCNFEVLSQKTICGDVPKIPQGAWIKELQSLGVVLSDHTRSSLLGSDLEIDILIGADVAGKLLTGGIHHLKTGPVALETELGWVLMGKIPRARREEITGATLVTTLLTHEATIADLWKLDSLGITDPAESKTKEEQAKAAMDHFERTVRMTTSGRYEIALPWIAGHPELPSNRDLALRRLTSTVKKLSEAGRLTEYQDVFLEWLEEGVIEEIRNEGTDHLCHYLPHRAVIKESSETTKIRPVFDASAKMKDAPSLNQCLEKGPNMIELIPSVLQQFRLRRIGVISDLRRAFLQIGVQETDRDFLRFFWWQDGDPTMLRVYRHKRVVFGVSASPFLLAATLDHHLKKAPENLRASAEILRNSLYVDNCVTSMDDEVQLDHFMKESRELMSSASWDLRGWRHSFTDAQCSTEKGLDSQADVDREAEINVLGLLWDTHDDSLRCALASMDELEVGPVTKRKMLSAAHRIFDPIGFSCPVTLWPKMQLQQIWEMKVSWDQELPEPVEKAFKRWLKQLSLLNEVKVPRWILKGPWKTEDISLHVYCDASQSAYATCIYIRTATDLDVSVQLIQAKTRVAPLKRVTIPRLELLACCVGARLLNSVKKDLPEEDVTTYYWTDSNNALWWIKTEDSWGTFVWNRVKEIRALSDPRSWRHVPGSENPADLPSRGCTAQRLLESRWWEGPSWLRKDQSEWPQDMIRPDEQTVNAEKKVVVVSSLDGAVYPVWSERFSSYWKIVRAIAWMYRFCNNSRPGTEQIKGPLTLGEVNHAEARLLRAIQRESFQGHQDKSLSSLELLTDQDGVLRVKTRILMREDTLDFKFPVVLPSKHPVVALLIQWTHQQLSHSGIQVVMATLRERYWILKGRKVVRQVVRQCGRCRRYGAKKTEAMPAPLPKERVRDSAVFETTGIDLAGPLTLRGGNKVWVVLFTCAVYRAVHMELVTTLSTEGFFQAFRRFVARRGRPAIIFSDNGTNFVGAENAFKSIDWEEINNLATLQRIKWKFNPPTAAWWGGWWERLIGLLKGILRRVLGRASLTYEEFSTVLCDSEWVMNSRPLTYLSEENGDLVSLSPALFLWDLPEVGVPDIDAVDHSSLNKRHRYRQRIRDALRQRFRVEYLAQLKQKRKDKSTTAQVAVGDVMLIGSDNSKRLDWPMGRIIEVIPGRDGHVRVCRLKTAQGELLRPVQRLFPLEVTDRERQVKYSNALEPRRTGQRLFPLKVTDREKDESSDTTKVKISKEKIPKKKVIVDRVQITRAGRRVKPPDRLQL